MAAIKCFWLEQTKYVELSLRRYKGVTAGSPLCTKSGLGYHNGVTVVTPKMRAPAEYPNGCGLLDHPDYPHTDKRWPTRCPCGFEFDATAHWQVNMDVLYIRADTGEEMTLRSAPVGAMWDAWWYDYCKGPDGLCLVVKTPGGEWIVDHTSTDGKSAMWSRTGDPRVGTVTANPSIGIGEGHDGKRWKYHGWLRDGYLVDA